MAELPRNYLGDFTELVNKQTDSEMLEAAESLMNDLAAISNMKQKIELLEKDLHKGNKAAFYFFAMELDDDQVTLAAQTVKGRVRTLAEKAKREAGDAEEESEEE